MKFGDLRAKYGTLAAAAILLAVLIWEFIKDALIGWVNERIWERREDMGAALEQAHPLVINYGVPFILSLLLVGIIYLAYRTAVAERLRRHNEPKRDASPDVPLIQANLTREGLREPFTERTTQATTTIPDRMPMIEFLAEAQRSGWHILSPNSQINEFAAAIRQAGADGVLSFYGRPCKNHSFDSLIRNEVIQPIPSDHWRDFEFDWWGVVETEPHLGEIIGTGKDNFRAITLRSPERGFADLHVERGDARAWFFRPLHDAARILYERARTGLHGKFAEWDDGSPQGVLDYYGAMVAHTMYMPVYGKRPPSTVRELIGPADVERLHVEGGAAALANVDNQHDRYVDLEIRESDFQRVIKEL